MQRKDLALRVLSTAAIMSIVTSIAAPAFANVYYIGNGSIDVKTITKDGKQYVEVKQGTTTYQDESDEIVIKDGTDEDHTTLTEADRAEGTRANPAVAPAAGAATQELEAAGSADAAGEGQPDPDDAFTLNETGEDADQNQEGNNPTENPTEDTTDNHTEDTKDNPTEPPKKDVVYQYDPAADPEQEQQATKLAPTTSAAPAAKTKEATQDDAPTTPASPVGSADNPTTNVIRIINDWAEKVLNIRLSNVNVKVDGTSRYADGTWDIRGGYYGVSAAEVQGAGNTKIELDGKNTLDSSNLGGKAGLNKQGNGTMTITDETDDTGSEITAPKSESDTSGSLTAKGGCSNGAAGIGGNTGEDAKNITIEGYATVDAKGGGWGAGIGGGGGVSSRGVSGNAENIIIQGHSKVTASAGAGAAIGGGSASVGLGDYRQGGSAKGIVICGHATVVAKAGVGAAIGAAGYSGNSTEAVVIIGTPGATADKENVHVTAIGGTGSAIGNGAKDTKVTIQGRSTIKTASSQNYAAIGSGYGNVTVNIMDNVAIDNEDTVTNTRFPNWVSSGIGGGEIKNNSGRTVEVNIDGGTNGNVKIGEESAITGNYGAISGTKVNIGDNVLLKMKQQEWSTKPYINVNGAEAEVGKRSNPAAGGLVNTIGNNTQLWYTDFKGVLQKIVHGKNVCKKAEGVLTGKHEDATCGKDGYDEYQCGYETANGAANTSCDLIWQKVLKATGAHDYGPWTTVKDATCTTEGEKKHTCTVCSHEEKKTIPVLGHDFHGTETVTKAPTCTTEGTKTVKCTRCDAVDTQTIPIDPNAHNWGDWTVDVAPTCTAAGQKSHHCTRCDAVTDVTVLPALGHQWHSDNDATHTCDRDHVTVAHSYSEWTTVKEATCTAAGQKQHTCTECGHVETEVIPATGHHWVDKGDGTHTCPDCGATEGQPFNTNSALELRVVDAEGMDQPFTVSENGTLRTYTGAYDTATLTGDLDTLRYLQDHGAQTIQFVTNGQTSSFAINDLLAQGSGSEVFYLTHRGAEEPTLLLVEADHSELVKD
ncbi:MAG: hypothetical protein ACLTAA_01515 [Faecalibacterium prausnitzii]